MRNAILIAVAYAAVATSAPAMPEPGPTDGPAALVANINRTIDYSEGSSPYYFTTAGRFVYFLANDGERRAGLWRTDGTTAGTILLVDFASPNEPDPWIGAPVPIGGDQVLISVSGAIWRSDGTPDGTRPVRAGQAYEITPAGDAVFFIEQNQLWTLDVASAAATPLTQFASEGYPLGPMRLYAVGDRLLFIGCTPETGCEPWRSDGTAAGTGPVRDIAPGPADGMPIYDGDPGTAVIDGILFFVGDDGDTGAELWRSDGTAAGTRRVRDIRRGAESAFMTPYGWHDGYQPQFTVRGRTLFFVASDGRSGYELWRSDGGHDGTRMVADLVPGADGLFDCAVDEDECEPFWRDRLTAVAHDTLYFVTRRPPVEEYGRAPTQLWRSDGTAAGTRLIEEGVDTAIAVFRDRLFFGRRTDTGLQLWMRAAADIPSTAVVDLQSSGPLVHASDLGMVLADFRDEPWWSDGTAAGTFLLKDIRGDDAGSYPLPLGAVGDVLLLGADDGVHGHELWRSDGTVEGTTLVADVVPGADGLSPHGGLAITGGLLFAADDRVHGRELWHSDGTAAGTRLVRDIQAGPEGALAQFWWGKGAVLDGRGYFAADDGIHGAELWRSDGTEAGTTLVADLVPGAQGSVPLAVTAWEGHVYFAASTAQGTTLWRTDGRATEPVVALPSDIYELVVHGDRAFFSAWGPDGEALWSVGRSGAAPVAVEPRAPYSLLDAGGALLGIHSGGLWRLGYGSLELYENVLGLQAFDRRTVFLTEGSYWQGRGIGTSGGTAESTALLQRLEAAEEGPSTYDCEAPFFTRAGDRVFFAAQAGEIGCELWALPLDALSEVCVEDCPPPPTPTLTEAPATPSPTPDCGAADCTQVIGGAASGATGETVAIDVSLRARREPIAAVQNDIRLSTHLRIAAAPDGRPNCTVNPDIGKPASAFVFLPNGCRPARDCTAVRALVLALDDVAPIADGSVLYTCATIIAPRAPLGELALPIVGVGVSTPEGDEVAVGAVDAIVNVLGRGDTGVRAAGGDGCQVGPARGLGWAWAALLVLFLKPPRRRG